MERVTRNNEIPAASDLNVLENGVETKEEVAVAQWPNRYENEAEVRPVNGHYAPNGDDVFDDDEDDEDDDLDEDEDDLILGDEDELDDDDDMEVADVEIDDDIDEDMDEDDLLLDADDDEDDEEDDL